MSFGLLLVLALWSNGAQAEFFSYEEVTETKMAAPKNLPAEYAKMMAASLANQPPSVETHYYYQGKMASVSVQEVTTSDRIGAPLTSVRSVTDRKLSEMATSASVPPRAMTCWSATSPRTTWRT